MPKKANITAQEMELSIKDFFSRCDQFDSFGNSIIKQHMFLVSVIEGVKEIYKYQRQLHFETSLKSNFIENTKSYLKNKFCGPCFNFPFS